MIVQIPWVTFYVALVYCGMKKFDINMHNSIGLDQCFIIFGQHAASIYGFVRMFVLGVFKKSKRWIQN